MTPEEQRLLSDLAGKIAQTPAPSRDPEAEEFIRKNIGSRPDALYLMTQTVLIQNMALQQAQQQIRDLQQRAAQSGYPAASSGSFLGGGYQTAPQQPQYVPPAPAAAPSFMQGSGGGGFLRGAAQTAAGVAAGALAFEGIRSLFEHPGYGGGGFGGGLGQAGFMGGAPVEETVVNNYYDSPDQANNSDDTQTQDADYDDSNDTDTGYDDSSNSDDIA